MGRRRCGLHHPTLAFDRLGLHLSVTDNHLSFRRDLWPGFTQTAQCQARAQAAAFKGHLILYLTSWYLKA